MNVLKKLEGQLVVSCQALEDEPLHSSEIMSKMALAAKTGGAKGIRANSVKDIIAIKDEVDLPVIGIIKRDYEDSDVFITATLKEIKELLTTGAEIIAMDATHNKRPNNEKIEDLIAYVRQHSPETKLMADISTVEEALEAEEIGFDCVGTTLVGYTQHSKGKNVFDHEFAFLKELKSKVSIPIIGEGKLNTPELARDAMSHGASFVVVGSAITRPQLITEWFVKKIEEGTNYT